MLRILQGETKFWYLTLTEKTTISNPTYLFSITHRLTNTTTNFILTDISAYVDRYNKFSVTEGTTFSVDSGEFLYRVYAQTSPSNLDPNLADELVEQGLLKVLENEYVANNYSVTQTERIYEVESDEIYNYKPLYYAYLKRSEIVEAESCLDTQLYNLAKQI
jgi:hypothetical protein